MQPGKPQHDRAQNSNGIQVPRGYAVVEGQRDFSSHFRSAGENAPASKTPDADAPLPLPRATTQLHSPDDRPVCRCW